MLNKAIVKNFVGVLFLVWTVPLFADDSNHRYVPGEEVIVWDNKVGPYHNPQETYSFDALPFCQLGNPEGRLHHSIKANTLGAILEGDELTDSALSLNFNVDVTDQTICEMEVTDSIREKLTDIVKQHYWYQIYIDELPMWGMVGEYLEGEKGQEANAFVFTHKEFNIGVNGNRIIEVNLTSGKLIPLSPARSLQFTYSVKWVETTRSFDSRFDRYLDTDFFEHQVHWFSIFNSFMMVLFVVTVVGLILMRTLNADYLKYRGDVEEIDMELSRVMDESGWKQVHGDVFRPPPYLNFYAALYGIGCQMFALAVLVVMLTVVADMYEERGSLASTALICYSLTSSVSGFTSASYYKANHGRQWMKTMVFTATLFPGASFLIMSVLNSVAVYYQSTSAHSFYTMVTILAGWLLVSLPLVVLGTIVGRSFAEESTAHFNNVARPIPSDNPWYATPLPLCIAAGVIPFGSIFIEMHYVFSSFWNYKFYYVYGFLMLVSLIAIIVIACTTIVAVYFLLSGEDYRWQWTAFLSGGSLSIYVMMYSIYYFVFTTKMNGALQTTFYYGYITILCGTMFLLGGAIGSFSAGLFVRRIYQNIKSD